MKFTLIVLATAATIASQGAFAIAPSSATAFVSPLTLPQSSTSWRQSGRAALAGPNLGRVSGHRSARLQAETLRSKPRGARMALRDRDSPHEREHLRKMVKDFLTQRSVQTYLFTLEQVGQRNDFDWLEGYMGHQGLSRVHGYGALRTGWKEYLNSMLRLPEQTVKKTFEYYRGGSKGNPFIQPQTVEHEATISPRKLSSTIMELRAQVSDEWLHDLQLIARENEEHWRHHLAIVTNGTDPEMALQHRLIEPRDTDSALRLDNYDLLEKFCTHVACTTVSMEMAENKEEEHQAMWFKTYMENKAAFAHVGTRGVGRQFLKDLLNEPPRVLSMVGGDEGAGLRLIDPMDIAARVMAERQIVAERWMEALEDTQEDQLNIHRDFMADCFTLAFSEATLTLQRLFNR